MANHTPNYSPTQDTTEEWRSIPGLEGAYEVSSHGRIRSLTRKTKGGTKYGHVVKQRIDRGGYLLVKLWANGKQYTLNSHRIVARVFIPNPFNLPEVNHLNGLRIDNRASNLQWVSHRGNALHAVDIGLAGHGARNRGALTPLKVKQIKAYLDYGLSQSKIAALFFVSQSTISNIHLEKTWKNIAYHR